MKKKKLKLKKQVWYVLAIIIFIPILVISIKKVQENYELKTSLQYLFTENGYTNEEYDLLKNYYTEDELNKLLQEEKNELVLSLMQMPNYKHQRLTRYLAFMEKEKNATLEETILYVNVDIDYDPYDDQGADLNLGYEILVNKRHLLPEDYIPGDLVDVSIRYRWGDEHKLDKTVYEAFLDMWDAASQNGLYLVTNYTYQPYADQEIIWNKAKDLKGTKYADRTYVRAGADDHQTGYSLHIFEKSSSKIEVFKESEANSWLQENAYKYGFILRFPEGKEDITGYASEINHYRYVGKEAASVIHSNNITLEEYIANYK